MNPINYRPQNDLQIVVPGTCTKKLIIVHSSIAIKREGQIILSIFNEYHLGVSQST